MSVKRAAVVGWPAARSMSPRLYAGISELVGRDLSYRRVAVPPPGLKEFVARVRRAPGWVGFNVTLPHKEAVRGLLDRLDGQAEAIGAVNLVRIQGGRLIGHNTDWAGFLDALRERRLSVSGVDAVLFGAGGAARAVAFGLGKAGASSVRIVNRDADRAKKLARDMNSLFNDTRFTSGAAPRGAAAWINATPLGMTDHPSRSPLPADAALKGAWAYDLVYRPASTLFLRQAEGAGAQVIGGLDMLIHQALRSWEWWFGRLGAPRRAKLKNALARGLAVKL